MRKHRRMLAYLLPAALALVPVVWLSGHVEGGGAPAGLEQCHHRGADGRSADRIDLNRLERRYRALQDGMLESLKKFARKVTPPKGEGHHSGVPPARSERVRKVTLKAPIPPRFRRHTFFFVRVPRGGGRPRILPRNLSKVTEVFALEAESLEDVARLSKGIGRRVTLATADLAERLGVTHHDARVAFGRDGKTAVIEERMP